MRIGLVVVCLLQSETELKESSSLDQEVVYSSSYWKSFQKANNKQLGNKHLVIRTLLLHVM